MTAKESLWLSPEDIQPMDTTRPGRVVQIRLPQGVDSNDETSDEHDEVMDNPLANMRPSEVEEMLENNSLVAQNLRDEDDHGLLSPITGFFSGCLAPVFSVFSRKRKATPKARDEFEIPFEDLKNLEFVDSGGQGAVYKAEHQSEIVAVKKVRDSKEIEIKHLLKLKHEHIIEFRYSLVSNVLRIASFCAKYKSCDFYVLIWAQM